jgi:hypothetical protein
MKLDKERLQGIALNPDSATEQEVEDMAKELLEARKRSYAGHCCEASYSEAFAKWMP